jgi:hypothetical protein
MRSKEGIGIGIGIDDDEVVKLFMTSTDMTSFYHIIY